MNKKSEFRILELIGYLVVVSILIIIGMLIYINFQRVGFREDIAESSALRSITASQKAFYMPEIECSNKNNNEIMCFDTLKLDSVFSAISSRSDYYNDLFLNSVLNVEEIYPASGKRWVIYYNPKKDAELLSMQLPVSLYNPLTQKRTIGVLYADYYK